MEEPYPHLMLEYVPLGNLEHQNSQSIITVDEAIVTLQQGLSALAFLHEQSPPVVHRDIKPENILVQSRVPFYIKLGDFGLSKAGVTLRTMCGTYMYLPPELARYSTVLAPPKLRYTHAVDVWSFGVVIFQFACGLPSPGSGSGRLWCKRLVKALQDWDRDNLIDLLSTMIVIEPGRRLPARECLALSLQLDCSSRQSVPIQATHGREKTPAEIKHSGITEHPTLDRDVRRLLTADTSVRLSSRQENRKRPTCRSSTSRTPSERQTKRTAFLCADKRHIHSAGVERSANAQAVPRRSTAE